MTKKAPDKEIMAMAIKSAMFSVATSNPPVFGKDVVRLIYAVAVDMSEKLLKNVIPNLPADLQHQILVALTTAYHEGVRLGIEYAKLGGSPIEGEMQ